MQPEINLPEFEITHSLITDIFNGICEIAQVSAIAGFYLGGSLAIGGFDESTSDLDFLVVLKDSLNDQQLAKIAAMHVRIRNTASNRLYHNHEGDYLTLEQASRPLAKNITAPHFGSDGHFDIEAHGPELIVDLWKIRKSGFIVFGTKPTTIIGTINTEDMLRAKIELFASWWLPKLENKASMNDEYQAYAVLTMARILYGIKMKDEVSKKQAATWLIETNSEFKELVARSLDWHEGMVMGMQDEVYNLIDYTNQQIQLQ